MQETFWDCTGFDEMIRIQTSKMIRVGGNGFIQVLGAVMGPNWKLGSRKWHGDPYNIYHLCVQNGDKTTILDKKYCHSYQI